MILADSTSQAPETEVPALRVENVRFSYPARRGQQPLQALRGISLDVPAGQSVAMLGPNGSGKSTLLKLICGMLPLESGDGAIRVFGASEMIAIRRTIGVVFQTESLDRHMTVLENLRDQATLYGMNAGSARDRINSELARTNLQDRAGSLVKSLSKGLARQVDLVRALLHDPRMLLLDEPTVGLDPVARERFLADLETRRRETGMTLIMSTHLVDEADRADRVLLIHEGKLVADDSPAELRRRAGTRRVTVLDNAWSPPAGEQPRWRRIAGGAGWSLALNEDDAAASRIASKLAGAGVAYSMAPPSLADVFEQLTGTSLGDDHSGRSGSAEPSR